MLTCHGLLEVPTARPLDAGSQCEATQYLPTTVCRGGVQTHQHRAFVLAARRPQLENMADHADGYDFSKAQVAVLACSTQVCREQVHVGRAERECLPALRYPGSALPWHNGLACCLSTRQKYGMSPK